MQPVHLIHHSANRGRHHPPSSLPGLAHCLQATARIVEVDIVPLHGGDFALLHDGHLDSSTEGRGDAIAATAAEIAQLHYRWQGRVSEVAVGLLSQAVELVRQYPQLHELQLDLKPYAPLTDDVLMNLLDLSAPVKGQIRISCVADWAVRRLRALDTTVLLGFDPMLYLEPPAGTTAPEAGPPFRTGAYGYRDDHPLSAYRWGSTPQYLAQRAAALRSQVPAGSLWYIRGALLAAMLDDGFDWIDYLHREGEQVAAWTLDATRPADVALARRLVTQGVDRITTDDPPALAAALGSPAEF